MGVYGAILLVIGAISSNRGIKKRQDDEFKALGWTGLSGCASQSLALNLLTI